MKVYAPSFYKNDVTGVKHHPGGKKGIRKRSHAGSYVRNKYFSFKVTKLKISFPTLKHNH
jgi:hypothetical protein